MRTNKLVIQINKSTEEVFEFVSNPVNTPKWIDFIEKEETNEWPPKLGTIYKNQDKDGNWQTLEITEFEKDKMFVMTNPATGYKVKYTVSPTQEGSELEYYEWMESGDLEDPFSMAHLNKLKSGIEDQTGNT